MEAVIEMRLRMPLTEFMKLAGVAVDELRETYVLEAGDMFKLHEDVRREIKRRIGNEVKAELFTWHIENLR